MIFVPLSFCATLLLLVLIARTLQADDGSRSGRPFLLLLLLFAVQTFLVGLRWGYGVTDILPLLTAFASLIPPASYLAFRGLVAEDEAVSPKDWPHALPALLIVTLFLTWRAPIDIVIIAEFLAYGGALLWLARRGPDGLLATRLDGVLRSWRAMLLTGVVLLCSAVTDLAISLDLLLGGGRHTGEVISASTTIILLLLGLAAAAGGAAAAEREEAFSFAAMGSDEEAVAGETQKREAGSVPLPPSGEHATIAAELERIMAERRLYADSALNLARLARRLGQPARAVSNAVNRVHGVSVSQYVNGLRIDEACRLLAETDMPVTRVFLEAGFMTKSNFNREFLRVTGMSPTAWRAAEGTLAGRAP